MARQNVQFKGLRHTPSDITGQDGDLLECVNLIHENGELKPLEMPEKTDKRGFYTNDTLVAVHNITGGKKFVYAVYNGVNTYIHVKDEDGDDVKINGIVGWGIPLQEIKWAETIGNTLIIGTDKSTHYALYKNGQYKWLGDKLPQPVFEFDFKRDAVDHDGFTPTSNGYEINSTLPHVVSLLEPDLPLPGGGLPVWETTSRYYVYIIDEVEENKRRLRDWLKTHIAKANSIAANANTFIFPFFARYAVLMYDNSYVEHSAPILLLPSTINPLLAYLRMYSFNDDTTNNHVYLTAHPGIMFLGMELMYKFKGFVDENGNSVDITDWRDIIKGVDLFLSSQVHSVDYAKLENDNNIQSGFYSYKPHTGDYDQPDYDIRDFGHCYTQNNKFSWYDILNNKMGLESEEFVYHNEGTFTLQRYYDIDLPSLSLASMKEKLSEVNLFYRVKRYSIDDLLSQWDEERRFSTEAETGILERLETLPTLPDDYVSRSRMTGSASYNYNQRLILGNISLQTPSWYPYTKQFNKEQFLQLVVMFKIEKPEKTIYVPWTGANLGRNDFGHYLYYPDPDCKEAIISDLVTVRRIPMSEHPGLHGAYALMPEMKSLSEAFSSFAEYDDTLPTPSTDMERYYSLSNTIAMSSVANPFHFPATNFKDIGRAKVIGIAANMLDVSSAQWGQYPIYVFCSDGIIAVMIDGEGKMGGIQAVSADVLREPHGLSQPTLVQTGQTLMFLTQRGVMAIAGTKISCVSEAMEGRHFNPMRELADIDYRIGAFQNLITRTSDNTAFVDFAASGFLAYDYAHNRVMLLRSDKDYQYLFDMKTGLWSKQIVYTNLPSCQLPQIPDNNQSTDRGTPLLKVKPIHAAVNNYTEMYLQDTDGYLYKTMEVMDENATKQLYQYGYLVSRPIRFGTDEYKTLVRTLHRYTHFANMSFVKMALYGSRDGVKYGRLNTLRGMSYKYFIFAIYTYLKPNERYSYLSVDFETRLSNKLR